MNSKTNLFKKKKKYKVVDGPPSHGMSMIVTMDSRETKTAGKFFRPVTNSKTLV